MHPDRDDGPMQCYLPSMRRWVTTIYTLPTLLLFHFTMVVVFDRQGKQDLINNVCSSCISVYRFVK